MLHELLGGEEPSLKAFALALDVPATRLYAIAKKPVPVYDPAVVNWDTLNDYFSMKLTETADYADMEALVQAAKEKDTYLAENQSVRVSTGNNLIDVDGGKMPKRKSARCLRWAMSRNLCCASRRTAWSTSWCIRLWATPSFVR